MKQLEQDISPLIENQLPAFYKDYGPSFLSFVDAYYEWLQANNNPLGISRNVMTYDDVDTTIDEFIGNFKDTYIQQFPTITSSNTAFIIKHVKDFYNSKGSAAGINLLFQLVFGTSADIYTPNDYIMRLSDGQWIQPEYLELDIGDRAIEFSNKVIFGSQSGATAYVEGYLRKRINGRFLDVLFISGRTGNFLYGELITDTKGNLVNAPRILGSLSSVNITNGGSNNKIGDLFSISGGNGIDGQARVIATVDGTGRVVFTLEDGGSGYTNSALVYVSNVTALYTNLTNSNTSITNFAFFEQVTQPLAQYPYITLSGANNFILGETLSGINTTSNVVATGYVVNEIAANSTTGTLVISVLSGNFALANTIIVTPANTINAKSGGGITSINATARFLNSNATALGLVSISNTFYGSGAYIIGGITNTYCNIAAIGTGNGASFTVGAISETEPTFELLTDFFTEYNFGNVQFITYPANGSSNNWTSVFLNGSNANNIGSGVQVFNVLIGANGIGYANTDKVVFTGGTPTTAANATITTNTTGGIATAPLQNTGSGYLATPSITITNSSGGASNGSGGILYANCNFSLGFPASPSSNIYQYITTCLSQNSFTIGTIISIANQDLGNNYNLAPFVEVIQPTIIAYNKRDFILNIANTNGLFAPGQILYQVISGNTAEGIVKTANSTIITARRVSFNTTFIADGVTPLYSANIIDGPPIGQAVITFAQQDPNTAPMGENANVEANVVTATGIASAAQVLWSGFGYFPNDALTLTSNTNQFIITASANVFNQGIGLGYWGSTRGLLDEDMILHDNDVYQEFSYVVQSSLSLDKYADLLKDLFHVAGSMLSAEVIRSSQADIDFIPVATQVELH